MAASTADSYLRAWTTAPEFVAQASASKVARRASRAVRLSCVRVSRSGSVPRGSGTRDLRESGGGACGVGACESHSDRALPETWVREPHGASRMYPTTVPTPTWPEGLWSKHRTQLGSETGPRPPLKSDRRIFGVRQDAPGVGRRLTGNSAVPPPQGGGEPHATNYQRPAAIPPHVPWPRGPLWEEVRDSRHLKSQTPQYHIHPRGA